MKLKYQKMFFVLPPLIWLLAFFIVPLCIVLVYSFCQKGDHGDIVYSFTLENYLRILNPKDSKEAFLYLTPVLRSLKVAVISSIFCLLLGYPLAYVISQSPKYKNILLLLVMLPFWTNFLVRTYAWIIILRTEGLLNNVLMTLRIIQQPLEILNTETAVIIGLVYTYLPFMVLPLYAAFEKLDKTLIEVAKDLKASDFQIFKKIILPLTLPGIISGTILVFIPSLSAFITSDLLGGAKTPMIGNIINDQFKIIGDYPFGSAISFLLMALILVQLMVYIRLGQKSEKEKQI